MLLTHSLYLTISRYMYDVMFLTRLMIILMFLYCNVFYWICMFCGMTSCFVIQYNHKYEFEYDMIQLKMINKKKNLWNCKLIYMLWANTSNYKAFVCSRVGGIVLAFNAHALVNRVLEPIIRDKRFRFIRRRPQRPNQKPITN